MRPLFRIRTRLFLTILPLVIAVMLAGGSTSLFEARTAITRLANRHLVFKAEQLRDYFFSEWSVISDLGFGDNPEYRAASQNSFSSYAYSLLREESEAILVLDADGYPVMNISYRIPVQGSERTPLNIPDPGWFENDIFGEHRVGIAFEIEPFDWTVLISDSYSSFFTEIETIRLFNIVISFGSVGILILLLSAFIIRLVRPIERLTSTIQQIESHGDMDARVRVETPDEVGILAENFNTMMQRLRLQYDELERAGAAEQDARRVAIAREAETLIMLSKVSDIHDEETGAHQKRIGIYAQALSRMLGKDESFQRLLLYAAPLHDIGKLGIPESIILKNGPLSKEEFDIVKQHTVFGHEMLRDSTSEYLREGAVIAHTHHEKFDGTGYPRGLAGEDIPLSGRIVALVDVFDALTSARPYKRAWSPEEAIEHIRTQSGKHFDPVLVDLFLANQDEFIRINTL